MTQTPDRKRITQTDIALKAGVARSTVNRVLNKSRTHRAGQDTIMKVLRAAKTLGYDHKKQQVKTERREAERKDVNIAVEVDFVLKTGQTYDTGTATIRNMSPIGALLTNLQTGRDHLPTEPVYARLTLKGEDVEGVSFRAEFVRKEGISGIQLGIRFERLLKKTQDAVKKILADAG